MKQNDRTPRNSSLIQPARRRFIQTFLAAGATFASPTLLASLQRTPERSLALKNLHTGESLKATFWQGGDYVADQLQAVNRVLRDHRSGDVYPMDPDLLNLLYLLQASVGVKGAFHVISGYRSPASNEKLRASSNGVARKSLHMQGKAIDIQLPGCELKKLRAAALSLQAGGVGYYPRSGFIHLDTGRVRHWSGS